MKRFVYLLYVVLNISCGSQEAKLLSITESSTFACQEIKEIPTEIFEYQAKVYKVEYGFNACSNFREMSFQFKVKRKIMSSQVFEVVESDKLFCSRSYCGSKINYKCTSQKKIGATGFLVATHKLSCIDEVSIVGVRPPTNISE